MCRQSVAGVRSRARASQTSAHTHTRRRHHHNTPAPHLWDELVDAVLVVAPDAEVRVARDDAWGGVEEECVCVCV